MDDNVLKVAKVSNKTPQQKLKVNEITFDYNPHIKKYNMWHGFMVEKVLLVLVGLSIVVFLWFAIPCLVNDCDLLTELLKIGAMLAPLWGIYAVFESSFKNRAKTLAGERDCDINAYNIPQQNLRLKEEIQKQTEKA